ncbi:efflux RND transporter periplasmic adaptor subunit [Schlegelella sp. ID0723]|uniref:Efflux RND transporter periplasmic adaptor subunit n=1 Tax=Piscinibacter koreensis TaxID=2742824 RepID=A0A7Y6NK18_9BURK|nr:efflux RND transporter periplasmic adaptor subunit [Schlegelella koreensis]
MSGSKPSARDPRRTPVLRPSLWALPLLVMLAACGPKNGAAPGAPGAPGGAAPPPPEVGVVVVKPEPIGLTTELPGRLEASRVAEVRARAAGIVLKRLFTEGSDVRAGQPLFQIDPATYQANVASAQATLARAQASLTQATAQAERYRPLVEANAISRQEYVNAVAAQKAAEADVAAARAALRTGQISLGYASVTAPIAGRIGRALVTEGALVGQGEPTPLAVIQQINPMYVNFTQSTSDVLRLRRAVESGEFRRAGDAGAARVQIVLEDGTVYSQAGKLLFQDLTVDPTSGQITLRAEVPNPQRVLLPGMYVRVRLEQAQTPSGIVLPQQAVTRGTTGDTVMVVGADGMVAPRPVKIGSAQGNRWIVLEGLKPGEQVMVDGFQKLRPNTPVKPVSWQPPASAAASGAAVPAGSGPGVGGAGGARGAGSGGAGGAGAAGSGGTDAAGAAGAGTTGGQAGPAGVNAGGTGSGGTQGAGSGAPQGGQPGGAAAVGGGAPQAGSGGTGSGAGGAGGGTGGTSGAAGGTGGAGAGSR